MHEKLSTVLVGANNIELAICLSGEEDPLPICVTYARYNSCHMPEKKIELRKYDYIFLDAGLCETRIAHWINKLNEEKLKENLVATDIIFLNCPNNMKLPKDIVLKILFFSKHESTLEKIKTWLKKHL